MEWDVKVTVAIGPRVFGVVIGFEVLARGRAGAMSANLRTQSVFAFVCLPRHRNAVREH